MDIVSNFQNNILPVYIEGLQDIIPLVSQFFSTTFGFVVLIFGMLYLVKIALKVFRHIQNEAFCRSIGL